MLATLSLIPLVALIGLAVMAVMVGGVLATTGPTVKDWGTRIRLRGIALGIVGVHLFIGAACALLEQLRP